MEEEKIFKVRHSLAHILAMAILRKFPDAKLGVGPVIENGFYYDFLLPEKISDADLAGLEKEMKKIVKEKIEFKKSIASRTDALEEVKKTEQNFKTELINDLPENEELSFYQSGEFKDLCRGPHVSDSSEINSEAFCLTHLAGAYWRGDEKRETLTRVYGLAFESKEELEAHLKMLEEAKKRDHRVLGKQLDLFTFSELVGPGLPLWTPKGTLIRQELDAFIWQLRSQYDYQKVTIPHITKKDLYEVSGHWQKFSEELFKINTREGHEFAMKPMNCPHHTQIYNHLPRSYRDLPQRYAETTMVYRDEQSGELSGLSRVRCITQDDAHVFCREIQVKEEVLKIVKIIQTFYQAFGFELKIRLSLHDPAQMEKYLGDEETWKKTENDLRELLNSAKLEFSEGLGEAAMYGPKIDFMAQDSIGRGWQVATIQLDRNLPERFDLFCNNEQGEQERIVMIHAAIAGSLERFTSVLIEHLAGDFPLWLSPVQIKILTVSENHVEFSQNLAQEFKLAGLRVEIDDSNETLGNKIRKNSAEKIPYTLVIGDREINSQELAVRVRGQKDLLNIDKEKFIQSSLEKIKNRDLNL
ncbi:threonine--tRNA ligase [Candidatus Nomurabacteria bacterium]|nr:threonine--tRNA ligase [Candidatus Nomurabacteria bacterium]